MGLGTLILAHGGTITGDEVAVLVGGAVLLVGAIAVGQRLPRAARPGHRDDDPTSDR